MEPEKFSNRCRAEMVLLCGVRESRGSISSPGRPSVHRVDRLLFLPRAG